MTQNVNTAVMDDPFAAADNAQLRPREYYGQLSVDAYFCKLVKGKGKVPWDSQVDPIDGRCTAITMILTPLVETGLNMQLRREMIAESVEWVRIVLPSIKAQGIPSAKQADGRWVRLVQEPTGRKYTPKSGGEEREATTFKLLDAYATEEACKAAYFAATGQQDTSEQDAFGDAIGDAMAGAPAAAPAGNNSKQRETAMAFVAALAKQHRGNLDTIKATVNTIPLITAVYDPESAEFAQLVAESVA